MARPGLMLLTSILAWLASLLGDTTPSAPPPKTDFDLPRVAVAFKLDREATEQAVPGEPTPESSAAVTGLARPEPLPAPKAEPPLLARPDMGQDKTETNDPVIDSQPGETTMIDSRKGVMMPLFFVGWFLAAAPLQSQAAEPGETADRLQKIEQRIGALEAQVKALNERIEQNAREVSALKEIAELRRDLAKLQTSINELRGGKTEQPRIAFSPPNPIGTVQLVNEWITPVSVVIDNVSYPLQPGQTRLVTQTPGNFTYEVLGVQPRVMRAIAAGETLTIRVGPQIGLR